MMQDYIDYAEITSNCTAADALRSIQADVNGLAYVLLSMEEVADAGVTPQAIDLLYGTVRAIAMGMESTFPLAIAALEELADRASRGE